MKDSKARVRVNVSGKRGELLQEQHAMNRLREPHDDVEAISLLEVPEPRVWKWDFPGEPEKKLRQDASSRHRRDTANVKETLDPHVDPSADVRDIKTRIVGEEVRKAAAQQHAPSANGYRGVDGAATRVPSTGHPG
ncbi:hypothetical protein, partial [Paenibacillus sp. JCM 10914]|uniref:hypothetical protein n=1 Tax=Paenibacillus sp. JCM 10914 TaxID=1236974 RepID=UPI000569DEC9